MLRALPYQTDKGEGEHQQQERELERQLVLLRLTHADVRDNLADTSDLEECLTRVLSLVLARADRSALKYLVDTGLLPRAHAHRLAAEMRSREADKLTSTDVSTASSAVSSPVPSAILPRETEERRERQDTTLSPGTTNLCENIIRQKSEGEQKDKEVFKLFVQNLPSSFSDEQLVDQLRTLHPNGAVTVRRMRYPGAAVCTLNNFEDANAALQQLNGLKVQKAGYPLRVNWYRPTSNGPSAAEAVPAGVGPEPTRVFVKELHTSVTRETLWDVMSRYGDLHSLNYIQDRGMAFVDFARHTDAVRTVVDPPTAATLCAETEIPPQLSWARPRGITKHDL